MKLRFVKMHGAGNDFVMVDDRSERLPIGDVEKMARLANRPDGVGCEGVIVIRNSAEADFSMRFFNPDGHEAEMCGNGARCVAVFAKEIGVVQKDEMRFMTQAGMIAAEIVGKGVVRVEMPRPRGLDGDFVNSGVPHQIVCVNDLEGVDVNAEGRKVRYSDKFKPAGTNVDFVRVDSPHALAIRTYERGVEAESGACGTGAVAAAVIGVANYNMEFPISVTTAGGYVLKIDGRRDGNEFTSVTLTGPVSRVFEGEIDI